ncbi:MAG: 50S ribosomal protein L22 [Candidatus Peribacteraceae bacterium]|nr:50S ribosomal protein L22 [Candidatus Peribacteraceae bacterium]
MKAYLQSVRIAPKKANLIAKMVRGMNVADAMDALGKTHKKAARIIEQLLRSAIANTSHNDKQDAQTMIIKLIVVNQGTAYRRGMPMARGRTRPFRKFLSHIDLELGFPDEKKAKRSAKTAKDASQKPKTAVKASAKKEPSPKSS